MHDMGVSRYEHRADWAREKGKELINPAVRQLFFEANRRFHRRIQEWLAEFTPKTKANRPHQYLSVLKTDVVTIIVADCLMNGISYEKSFAHMCKTIGKMLELEYRIALFRKNQKNDYQQATTAAAPWAGQASKKDTRRYRGVFREYMRKSEFDCPRWGATAVARMGHLCIMLFIESTKLFALKTVRGRDGKKQQVLSALPEVMEWLTQCEEAHKSARPYLIPAVDEPKDWAKHDNGGYPYAPFRIHTIVGGRQTTKEAIESTTARNTKPLFDSVNTLQRTAWRVNEDVFQVFSYLWKQGVAVADLPPRDNHPIPEKPKSFPDAEAEQQWKRDTRDLHVANGRLMGRRLLVAKIHEIAGLFQNQKFWYPYKCDFRGRAYPISSFLTPQGCDIARGLLIFDEGKPITTKEARDWLAIHGANCWGEDKVTLAERVQWVEDNVELILATHRNPLDFMEWTKADKPFQFLAWCIEWGEMLAAEAKGCTYTSRLPVQMDGTNNGLQLFSLLLRDEEGAKATNVSPSERPEDIYKKVADKATAVLKADADGVDEDKALFARQWLSYCGGEVPRKATKRPVMILPYGGTKFAGLKYLSEWFYETSRYAGKAHPFGNRQREALNYLNRTVWAQMEATLSGARAAMDWIQAITTTAAKLGMDLTWKTPCGLQVVQRCLAFRTMIVETHVSRSHKVKLSFARDDNHINENKQKNGASPNFIHSLDASVMHLTTNLCAERGVTSFSMIHDSFGTHAADAAVMAKSLREVVAEMFSGDLLEEFRVGMAKHIGCSVDHLPPPPKRGNLDPACVLKSDYFFA